MIYYYYLSKIYKVVDVCNFSWKIFFIVISSYSQGGGNYFCQKNSCNMVDTFMKFFLSLEVRGDLNIDLDHLAAHYTNHTLSCKRDNINLLRTKTVEFSLFPRIFVNMM